MPNPRRPYTQHYTAPFSDQNRNLWEQTISWFTRKIYLVGIGIGSSQGDFAALVGHNAFIRYSALKKACTRAAVLPLPELQQGNFAALVGHSTFVCSSALKNAWAPVLPHCHCQDCSLAACFVRSFCFVHMLLMKCHTSLMLQQTPQISTK